MRPRFSEVRKKLKADYSRFPKLKLAILGDAPTQLLHQAIRGMSFDAQLDVEIYEADFDQINLQVADPNSKLYRFAPEVVLIAQSSERFLSDYYKLALPDRSEFADHRIEAVRAIYGTVTRRRQARTLICNLPELDDAVHGSFANKNLHSSLFQFRRFNLKLMELAAACPDLFVVDVASLQNRLGRDAIHSARSYVNQGFTFDLEFWPRVAERVLQILLALRGKVVKAVIVDLDNTLWGGVIGDDGLQHIQLGDLGIGKAFSGLQRWLKELKERGIILCVCSKNFEKTAKEPFVNHPDMLLRLQDIAVFVANWENKVDNIQHIRNVLNIGFDSIVYLDDNPFERNMVKQAIPSLNVPELPDDPVDFLGYLQDLNLFETTTLSQEDSARTRQYREEAERATLQKNYASEDEFLASLDMVASAKPFDSFAAPRIAQLSQRSNQFNLRTIRYTEEDITRIAKDPRFLTLYFTLADRYGDYGLISVVILERQGTGLFIDTWLMSCRVLKRTMEQFVLNQIIETAMAQGATRIVGEYVPSGKNELVQNLLLDLGFTASGKHWELPATHFEKRPTRITQPPQPLP